MTKTPNTQLKTFLLIAKDSDNEIELVTMVNSNMDSPTTSEQFARMFEPIILQRFKDMIEVPEVKELADTEADTFYQKALKDLTKSKTLSKKLSYLTDGHYEIYEWSNTTNTFEYHSGAPII